MSQKALAIPEVVLHICRYLDTQSKCRCARVCKQFHSVALDSLWRSLNDLGPLIRIFADDCVGFADATRASLSITRPLVPSDWSRFQFYANKVLEASHHERPSLRVQAVSTAALNRLAIYRPTLRILPRLRKFQCLAFTSSGLLATVFLLSPTIVDLYIHFGGDVSDQAAATFFGTLLHYAAGLQSFRFSHSSTTTFVAAFSASLTPLLQAFEHVTSVSIPLSVINGQTLSRLAAMPALRSLFMTASRQSIVESDILGSNAQLTIPLDDSALNSFPALESLEIAARMPTTINIINSLSSPHVTSIHVKTIFLENHSQMTECLSAVAATCPTLHKLTIEIREKHRSEPPFGDDWYTLEPALMCRFLTHMTFECPGPLTLSEEALRRMCQAWPSLEFLSLNPRPSAYPDDRPPLDTVLTLSSLSIAVECCPRLKHLGLLIDALVPTELPRGVLSTTLSSLDLFDSRVLDIGYVATYINTAYPVALCAQGEGPNKILHITPGSDRNGSQESTMAKWRQVDTLLRRLQKLRADDTERISWLRSEVERSNARIAELEREIAMFKAQASPKSAGDAQRSQIEM